MIAVWLALGVVALAVGWFLLKAVVGATAPPEHSGRAFLQQQLVHLGVPPHVIPDAAMDDIVATCLQTARGVAALAGNKGRYGTWRANFVDSLKGTAVCIASLLKGETTYAVGPLYDVMRKHGLYGKYPE